jgi:hypothetical protein
MKGNKVKTIKLKINNFGMRVDVLIGLASSGYKVWVEPVTKDYYTNYYVCVEVSEGEIK